MPELIPLNIEALNPPLKVTRITSVEQLPLLSEFFEKIRVEQDGVIGFDLESTPLKDYYYRRLRTIQFGNNQEQFVCDLKYFCSGNSDLLYTCQGDYGKNLHLAPELQQLLKVIEPVVCTKSWLKCGVFLSFEYLSFYWLFGLRTFNFWDCAMVEKTIYAGNHSLKDYPFYSMEQMMERYFQVQIEKKYQESFTLDAELDDDQIQYAALDTRFPLGIRAIQNLILKGFTYKQLLTAKSPFAKYLEHIDPVVTGDILVEIAQIECDCIGSFEDMHVHGDKLDTAKWDARTEKKKEEFKSLIFDTLDPIFLPIVGSKTDVITPQDILDANSKWKAYNNPSDEEVKLKADIRKLEKMAVKSVLDDLLVLDNTDVSSLRAKLLELETARKAEKEIWKTKASELGKKRTKIKNLVAKCEGNALINYGSNAQLLVIIQGMKGLGKVVKSLDDETLEKYEHIPLMAAIRKYHGLAKEIGTYGKSWTAQWVTKPGKEEGWLHPGDGRLHCTFNQYDAETGRSSSSQPNAQNLPADKEIRECFVADETDESVRVSDCCNADTQDWGYMMGGKPYDSYNLYCSNCKYSCSTHGEEMVLVTCDMSGAELRIIAELAQDPIWIGAFNRGEDVHSVGTEILYEKEWPVLGLPECSYFKLKDNGEPQRKKCKCPEHNSLRNGTKSTNFLLAYGGGPGKLSKEIKKTLQQAKDLMLIHSQKFPKIWDYLSKSGQKAKILKKAFDMFGRRRLFPEPTREKARNYFIEDNEEKLRLDEDVCVKNITDFIDKHDRKPDETEAYSLTHRNPTNSEVNKSYMGLCGIIERAGKNHCIQGTNSTIAKISMGCAYDADGKPFLWHILPKYKARLIKFIHDELVISCPKRFAEQVSFEVQDAFRRAAAIKMKSVIMESEAKTSKVWEK